MKIELRKLSDIQPYPGNPRLNDGAVDAVAKSIEEFGFRQPVDPSPLARDLPLKFTGSGDDLNARLGPVARHRSGPFPAAVFDLGMFLYGKGKGCPWRNLPEGCCGGILLAVRKSQIICLTAPTVRLYDDRQRELYDKHQIFLIRQFGARSAHSMYSKLSPKSKTYEQMLIGGG